MEKLLKYKKEILDSKSKSFCGAKWYLATIFLNAGKTMSCYHNPYHEISDISVKENFKALHNTEIKKKERAQMLKGERPSGCDYCWKIEDLGPNAISDRVYRSYEYTDEENQIAFDADPNDDVDLRILELHFDKTCQMACSYCHPGYSTTWEKDIKNNGPYDIIETDEVSSKHYKYQRRINQLFKPDQENPYLEAFYKWWESDLHKTLTQLRILGGEPLLSPHIWKFIEWFKSKPSNCSLEIVSNLGPLVNVDKFLKSIQGLSKVILLTSNESTGSHSEYIRDGIDYDLWISNTEKCLDSSNINQVTILLTVGALSLFRTTDLLNQIVAWKEKYGSQRLRFTLNILRHPTFQNIVVLPDNIRFEIAEKLAVWRENNSSKILTEELVNLDRLITYIKLIENPHGEETDQQNLRKAFKSFFTQYDQRRNKNFTKTFPELADWFNNL